MYINKYQYYIIIYHIIHFTYDHGLFSVLTFLSFTIINNLFLFLTRNWAMSKAKSWTKLNWCSASGATWGRLKSLLTEHNVTSTSSQQSWAARQQKEQNSFKKNITLHNKQEVINQQPWKLNHRSTSLDLCRYRHFLVSSFCINTSKKSSIKQNKSSDKLIRNNNINSSQKEMRQEKQTQHKITHINHQCKTTSFNTQFNNGNKLKLAGWQINNTSYQ